MGTKRGAGVHAVFNGVIPALRSKGHTLQEIGDRCGVTRERIRQILRDYYPEKNQRPVYFITRKALSKLIKHSCGTIRDLENEGLLTPIKRGSLSLYHTKDIAKIQALVEERIISRRSPITELTCESCGVKFYRKYSYFRSPHTTGRFCSHSCLGKFYGFKAHPENIGRKGKKWDYDKVYKIRDKTGWGAWRIGRELGIPPTTVSSILRARSSND